MPVKQIRNSTRHLITEIFHRLDYSELGPIYCHEGGEEFWRAKWKPCQRLGIKLAEVLMRKLRPGGNSLYVGAGVAEIPALVMETLDLARQVSAYNLRRREVRVLNRACRSLPFRFRAEDAGKTPGRFDHLWIVSVLNDPERFPHLAPLSYGRADPVTFDPKRFQKERRIVQTLVDRCMPKLSLPGLVTTSTEEVVWIADWCHRHRIPYLVERRLYQTALVGDPICFIRIGGKEPVARGERRKKRARV